MSDPRATIYLKDYQPPRYLVDNIELNFHLSPENTQVSALITVHRNPNAPQPDSTCFLDGEDLELLAIAINQKELSPDDYIVQPKGLLIQNVPDRFTLKTTVRIQPVTNTKLEGLYLSSGNFCTQCEPEGFRRITYYFDRPDVMAPFKTTLIADKNEYPILLSNGNPSSAKANADGTHQLTWDDPFKKPSYLFALVAGDLKEVRENYTTASGRKVALSIFVEQGNEDKCQHAMNSLIKSMRWDEEKFGREYDLDVFNIVAVSDFNMGAMENKSLNIFNTQYILAKPETATDQDYIDVEAVVAHEYFHNWTGNRITCRDWFQLSLKEGLTVFREQEFSMDMNSRQVLRIADAKILQQTQFTEDAGPTAHPVQPQSYMEINNFYTATVYNKGAEVIRMLKTIVGEEKFRRGTDYYFDHYDGQAVTIEEWVHSIEQGAGLTLPQFRRWYDQAGTPTVTVKGQFDAGKQEYRLTMTQSTKPTPGQPTKSPFLIPIQVGLLSKSGKLMTEKLCLLSKEQEVFCFENIKEEPIPSLLRNFSAPVKIEFDYSDQELEILAKYDENGYTKFEAFQKLINQVFSKNSDSAALSAFSSLILNDTLDPALKAELLNFPTESEIASGFEQVDVDFIITKRQLFINSIVSKHKDDLMNRYHQLLKLESNDISKSACANRKLRNQYLRLLLQGDPSNINIASEQFLSAKNMTDQLAAFSALVQVNSPERQQAIDAFYQQWQSEDLVMDKWLSTQAASRLPGTLHHVRQLMDHPKFSIKNPNKVRALLGSFARGNFVHFHAKDGSGYQFIREQISRLDAINPQIAARLATVFTTWKRYDPSRQTMMKRELESLASNALISSDLHEIVHKSLQN